VSDARFGIATGAYFPEHERPWPELVARAAGEGWRTIELTAMTGGLFDALLAYLDADHPLAGFERVSIHAPVRDAPGAPERLPDGFDAILHPDVYGDASGLGPRFVFENMDVAKQFGGSVADLETVFARNAEAGFCLDVAHVWTNDPTLALGHELLEAFGDRLRQLHVSGIEPDGRHRPTTAADLALYAPLLERCGGVPWLLETELV
jgi:sugar phosphate isomerase/epimerase